MSSSLPPPTTNIGLEYDVPDFNFPEYLSGDEYEQAANFTYELQAEDLLSGGAPLIETNALGAVNRSLYDLKMPDIQANIWDSREAFIEQVGLKVYMVPPAIMMGVLVGACIWSFYLLSLRTASTVKKSLWLKKEQQKRKKREEADKLESGVTDNSSDSGISSSKRSKCNSIELETYSEESEIRQHSNSESGVESVDGGQDLKEDDNSQSMIAEAAEKVQTFNQKKRSTFQSGNTDYYDSSLPSSGVPSPCLERNAIIIHDSSGSISRHSNDGSSSGSGSKDGNSQEDPGSADVVVSKPIRRGHTRSCSVAIGGGMLVAAAAVKEGQLKAAASITLIGYTGGDGAAMPRRSSSGDDSSRYRSFEDEEDINAIKRCEDQKMVGKLRALK